MPKETAEQKGELPKTARRRPPLVPNGGRRTIKRMVVELDDGTMLSWAGTGSIALIGTTTSPGPAKPDIFYAEAILRHDKPESMVVIGPTGPDRMEGGA